MATLAVVRARGAAAPRAAAHARIRADAAHLAQRLAGAIRLLSVESVHIRCRTTCGRSRSQTFNYFRRPIARVADPFSLRLIAAVLSGRAPSYLDLDERPAEYEDVGRPCRWEPFYSDVLLERSRLEQIVMHALSGDKLRLDGSDYTPTSMQGWDRIVFRPGC